MQRDYTLPCLQKMPREELEQLSARLIQRLVPQEYMDELFTFAQEDVEHEDRLQAAQFDALLRMTAIALSELPALYSESDNQEQNVELLLKQAPTHVAGWVQSLTDLLHTYAEVHTQA